MTAPGSTAPGNASTSPDREERLRRVEALLRDRGRSWSEAPIIARESWIHFALTVMAASVLTGLTAPLATRLPEWAGVAFVGLLLYVSVRFADAALSRAAHRRRSVRT